MLNISLLYCLVYHFASFWNFTHFIRFGIGRFTTEEEVDYTARKCIDHVTRLREMSPLWEMVQEGVDLKAIQWSQH